MQIFRRGLKLRAVSREPRFLRSPFWLPFLRIFADIYRTPLHSEDYVHFVCTRIYTIENFWRRTEDWHSCHIVSPALLHFPFSLNHFSTFTLTRWPMSNAFLCYIRVWLLLNSTLSALIAPFLDEYGGSANMPLILIMGSSTKKSFEWRERRKKSPTNTDETKIGKGKKITSIGIFRKVWQRSQSHDIGQNLISMPYSCSWRESDLPRLGLE